MEENRLYSVTLSDGTILENLRLNGNNFISEEELSAETFRGKLGNVVISDGEGLVTVHENMKLIQVKKYGDEYWFILDDISEDELEKIQQRADIEYIAMMSGIEL